MFVSRHRTAEEVNPVAELTFAAEAHAISAAMADCCVTGAGWPREGRDEESWQLAVLAEQIGALGIPEPPAEDELPGLPPDPDGDQPPDTADDIPAALLIEAAAAERAAAAP